MLWESKPELTNIKKFALFFHEMGNRFLHKILVVALVLMSASLSVQAEELCMEGTLLFREDFGGNDPNDPAVSRTAVPGMSSGYRQIYKLQTSDPGTGFGAGFYLVAKRGYRNSTNANYSVWHIMDDHTYFGDTTRGYFLEIDGKGNGNDVFYSTVIDGLCEGSRLTFSAYVANLTTAGQYNGWRSRNYVHPKLSFVLTHPETGAELARYNTDTISHDWSNYPKSWRESADWQLVGMNFTVPEGIDSVRLSIRNNASGSSTGNDFALDDIEIRLCLIPDTILTDTLVCDTTQHINWRDSLYQIADTLRDTIFNSCGLDSVYYLLSVQTEHCEEPLCTSGILLFREDFGGNDPEDPKISTTPVPGMSYRQVTNDALESMGAGKYLVTKQGYCMGNGTSQWHLQDDHTYFGDLTRGYFLEIDGRGDHSAFYSTTIDGLCEGIGLTFSAYVANVMTWGMYMGRPGVYAYPRLKFVLTNPLDNSELATYDTGDIPFDSAFIGDNMCWQQSVEWQLVGMNFTVPNGVDQIQLTIYNNTTGSNGNDFAIDDIEIHLCMTPDTVIKDTLLCDTISKIQWREKAFVMADTLRDTLRSSCGFDSIYYVMKVETEHCEPPIPPCPDLITITADTTVCDTLMPYRWRDTLFTEAATYEILYKDQRDCDSVLYILTLSTEHCERPEPPTPPDPPEPPDPPTPPEPECYPIIVNKYNWVLLVDNVAVQKLFPNRMVQAYQWYKNGEPIPGANEDDYSEQDELHGEFQMILKLDGDEDICSNILEINIEQQAEQPIRIRIFNSHGMPVSENQITHGIYLYRYEQGDKQWTEKKLVQ